jgi:hypothetical protein
MSSNNNNDDDKMTWDIDTEIISRIVRSFLIQKKKGEDKYYIYFSSYTSKEVEEKGIDSIKQDVEVTLQTLYDMRDVIDKMIKRTEEGETV